MDMKLISATCLKLVSCPPIEMADKFVYKFSQWLKYVMALKCLWEILCSLWSALDLLLLLLWNMSGWVVVSDGNWWWKMQNRKMNSLVHPSHQKNIDSEQKLIVLWSSSLKTRKQNWITKTKAQNHPVSVSENIHEMSTTGDVWNLLKVFTLVQH